MTHVHTSGRHRLKMLLLAVIGASHLGETEGGTDWHPADVEGWPQYYVRIDRKATTRRGGHLAGTLTRALGRTDSSSGCAGDVARDFGAR
jgi:hypothetical protein